MSLLRYGQAQSPAFPPTTKSFLDTSFIVHGLGGRQDCAAVLKLIAGSKLVVSDLVCNEVIHVLTQSFFSNDLRELLLGTSNYATPAGVSAFKRVAASVLPSWGTRFRSVPSAKQDRNPALGSRRLPGRMSVAGNPGSWNS